MTRIIIICLLLSFSFFSIIVAQDKEQKFRPDSGLVVLTVNSGEEFVGTILAEDAREVSIRLQNGKMLIIPAYTVKSIRKLSSSTLIKGKPVFANPHPSRYFYTPSAIPMDKGEVYIQTLYAVAYQVQFGVTENFSLGATTTIVGTPLALTAKYSIKIDEKNTLAAVAEEQLSAKAAEDQNDYVTIPQMEKHIAKLKKTMEKAAKDLDFMEAARLRDLMFESKKRMEEMKAMT